MPEKIFTFGIMANFFLNCADVESGENTFYFAQSILLMEKKDKNIAGIKSWASDDRPREKLMLKSAEALSDSELMAILIASGGKNRTAVDLAKDVLLLGDNNLNRLGKLTLKDFTKVKGIGKARAIIIIAALELGRRRQMGNLQQLQENEEALSSSKIVAQYLQTRLQDYNHEVFAVLFLNQANSIISFEIISTGGLTGTVADPRIILGKALEKAATGMILCHNHPSGNLKPSKADESLTEKLKQAASYLDIRVLDHIIVSHKGYYSFADEGLL